MSTGCGSAKSPTHSPQLRDRRRPQVVGLAPVPAPGAGLAHGHRLPLAAWAVPRQRSSAPRACLTSPFACHFRRRISAALAWGCRANPT